jgi:ribosomal protein L9
MGRFDLLTQLETKPVQSTPLPEKRKLENPLTSKPVNQQADKEASQQTSKPVTRQTIKPVSKQVDLPVSQQTSKQLKKFTSYLREDSLKSLKRIAFETDRKDYEVLQEAIDRYLEYNRER